MKLLKPNEVALSKLFCFKDAKENVRKIPKGRLVRFLKENAFSTTNFKSKQIWYRPISKVDFIYVVFLSGNLLCEAGCVSNHKRWPGPYCGGLQTYLEAKDYIEEVFSNFDCSLM